MRRLTLLGPFLFLLAVVPVLWSASIQTEDDIETDGRLVSKVGTGTAPLRVSSSTQVERLNVEFLDGFRASDFALLLELQGAIAALDNPDPPCFDDTTRFVDCGNGTVTDTVTGLIWLEDASCLGSGTYSASNSAAATLAEGQCSLTDGSRVGDWRLPSEEEWVALVDPTCGTAPKIVGNGSSGGCYADVPWALTVQNGYWSSTTDSTATGSASLVNMGTGQVSRGSKTSDASVWPVRVLPVPIPYPTPGG